jgi:hypothetical protein
MVALASLLWSTNMKQALISPNEQVYSYDGSLLGERVAQVTTTPNEVAPPLFWTACNNDVVADQWYYDPATFTIVQIPVKPLPPPKNETTEEPVVI